MTGAGGFIGGRVVEIAYLGRLAKVRAGLRAWSGGARIARFPVPIEVCDVLNREQVARSVKGIDAVIHCAVGNKEVIVKGTENILDAALKARVKRFVHLSTAEVYGNVQGTINEEFPCVSMGNEYADSKIAAENLCREFAEKGLPVLILRPSIVYGPFCDPFTVKIAQRLLAGTLGEMKNGGNGVCNLTYVDDLVYCIFRSLWNDRSAMETFNVNGPDKVTWNDYFRGFSEALGIRNVGDIDRTKSRVKASAQALLNPLAMYVGKHYGGFVLKAGRKLGLERRLEGLTSFLHTTPTNFDLDLYDRKAYYSFAKAERMVGYSPRYNLETGLKLCVDWLEHEGYLKRLEERR